MEGDDGSSSPNYPFLLPIPSNHRHHSNSNLLCGEVERQLRLAAPLVAASLLQYSLQIISAMFVGHLGELPLSAVSLASSFANVTGLSVLLGMGSALDTLCGQANGAKQFHMLGIHMQRAILVLFITSIPLSLVWAYTSEILMAVGQNPEIAKEAGIYACWLIPGLFAYGLLQCHVRFLQSQSIVMPVLITSGVTTLLHILVCWILVYACGLGPKGFSREAFQDVLDFLRLAIPSTFMICLEYWSFEMVVLLSGLLPNPMLETSVLSISLNTMWMVYMIPTGLGSAVSVRVSNELGSGNPQAARLSVRAVVIISVIEGLIVAIATILMRNIWGNVYSNEREVVKYVSVVMPLLAISDFMDGIQCVLSGAARGLGWQKICSYINLGAYYVVGFPSSILFAFVLHVGGKGLWMGIICALAVQMFLLLAMILRTDWDKETRKAGGRVNSLLSLQQQLGDE